MTELTRAAEEGDVGRVRKLLMPGTYSQADIDEALCYASLKGHLEVVCLLLDAGADVHARDEAALFWASEYGHLEVVRLLLQAGADVHVWNDYALVWASLNDHLEVVRLLLQHKADVSKIVSSFYQSMSAVQPGLQYQAPNIPQDQLAKYQTYSALLNVYYYKELSHSILGYM